MQPFRQIEGIAAPITAANIDTDQIIPARFLQKPRREGYGQYLFHDLRFVPDGSENADFVLNRQPYRDACIIVAGPNFGCGSSRENAVWALWDYGIHVVIAPSFGDIFHSNCLKNGLLPVVLPAGTALAEKLTVDLRSQTVTVEDGVTYPFEIDPFARHCLLEGIDELDYTLSVMDQIVAFENTWEG